MIEQLVAQDEGRILKIGVVVLTYNCLDDFFHSLDGLVVQRDVETRIVVVDNASKPEQRAAMEEIFIQKIPDGKILDATEATSDLLSAHPALFVRNSQNSGYSAGNNVGARLAVGAGCEAVLILNPDIRLIDEHYISDLWLQMKGVPDCSVASSRVVDLSGRDEHPLRETGFWEELLWIRQLGPSILRAAPTVIPPSGFEAIEAQKLHGSCLMIRASFLESMGFFDEGVFLYSEEPILAARVRSAGGKMMVFPELKAIHAHVPSTKGDPSQRMLQFIESRRYYIEKYTEYGSVRKAALQASYGLLAFIYKNKARFSKVGKWNKTSPIS